MPKNSKCIKSSAPTIHCKEGVTKVTSMDSLGTTIHPYSKESMKTACLEEIQAQFMQANDTQFLTDPLISDLEVIGIQLENFDHIASRKQTKHLWEHLTMLNNFYHC